MAPQVLHRVIYGTTTPTSFQLSRLTIRPALLLHYTRHRVCDCDYPAIIPSSEPGASVRGTYVQGFTEGDQWRLDLFEGDQYNRIKVRPQLLDESGSEGWEVEAETYVWVDEETGLEAGEWDFEVFRREKMGRWVGSGEEYVGELRPSIAGVQRMWEAGHEADAFWQRSMRLSGRRIQRVEGASMTILVASWKPKRKTRRCWRALCDSYKAI